MHQCLDEMEAQLRDPTKSKGLIDAGLTFEKIAAMREARWQQHLKNRGDS